MKNIFFASHRSISGVMILLVITAMLITFPLSEASAQNGASQKQDFFIANGRRVLIDSFNKKVDLVMKEVGVPGLSLAVISNNKVAFFNAYGDKVAGKNEKVDKETVFEACSLSKSFLLFAALRLADEKKLDLDKPMYQYLKYEPLEHDARYKLITTRMVLSHSSGIENWQRENNPDSLEILSDPGTKFIYSGEGYQYLAKIIALIVHKPYEEYMPELVFAPLHLKRTFCRYTDNGLSPANYATGHNDFEKPLKKEKNLIGVPASGVLTTAMDYAVLISSIFNKKYLSDSMIRTVLTPIVRAGKDDASSYYGPGFNLFFTAGDTLVAFAGNNDGFKGEIFYSVRKKCGLVFFSNGDLGKLIAVNVTDMAVHLDVRNLFKNDFYEQYPSNGLALFTIYREKGSQAMLSALEALKEDKKGKIGINTLNHLSDMLASGGEIELARTLTTENIKLYPESSQAFYMLGEINFYFKDYQQAYTYLSKAKELLYNDDPGIDYTIKQCAEKIGVKAKTDGPAKQ